MVRKPLIVLLAGPTASGKSKVALRLSKDLNGEIINADSMQVYKELKILTSRPSCSDEKKAKHHLYGFISVKKNFSTGAWLRVATEKINLVLKKKRIPILVGGTGLYFKVLIDGLVKIPNISSLLRKKIMCQMHYPYSLNKVKPFLKKTKNNLSLKNSEN